MDEQASMWAPIVAWLWLSRFSVIAPIVTAPEFRRPGRPRMRFGVGAMIVAEKMSVAEESGAPRQLPLSPLLSQIVSR